jgi:hypothetical protein
MDRRGYRQCRPHYDASPVETRPLLGLKSGYVQRALDLLPKQGRKAPWVLRQNYLFDLLSLQFGAVDDGTLVFTPGATPKPEQATSSRMKSPARFGL